MSGKEWNFGGTRETAAESRSDDVVEPLVAKTCLMQGLTTSEMGQVFGFNIHQEDYL